MQACIQGGIDGIIRLVLPVLRAGFTAAAAVVIARIRVELRVERFPLIIFGSGGGLRECRCK